MLFFSCIALRYTLQWYKENKQREERMNNQTKLTDSMDAFTKNTYLMLYKELNILLKKIEVYNIMWGNDSNEVKELDKKVYDINLKLLDILDEHRGL